MKFLFKHRIAFFEDFCIFAFILFFTNQLLATPRWIEKVEKEIHRTDDNIKKITHSTIKTVVNVGTLGLVKKRDAQKAIDHVGDMAENTIKNSEQLLESVFNHPERTLKSPKRLLLPVANMTSRNLTMGLSDVYVHQEQKKAVAHYEKQQREKQDETNRLLENSKNKLQIQSALNQRLNYKAELIADIEKFGQSIEIGISLLDSCKNRMAGKMETASEMENLGDIQQQLAVLITELTQIVGPDKKNDISPSDLYEHLRQTVCYNSNDIKCRNLAQNIERLIVFDDDKENITEWFETRLKGIDSTETLMGSVQDSIAQEETISLSIEQKLNQSNVLLRKALENLSLNENEIGKLTDKLRNL